MKINGKEVKFDFAAFFRANKLLSTSKDADDGAGQLWLQFVTENDMAVPNAVKVLVAGITDEELYALMDAWEESGEYEANAKAIEEELHRSGFFHRAAKRLLKLTEKYTAAKKAKTDAEKIQMQVQKDTLDAMRKSL